MHLPLLDMSKPLISLIAIVLASCAAVGTKTLYKSDLKPEILKIGVTDIAHKDELSYIFPQTNKKFKESVDLFAAENATYKVVFLHSEMDYENPNKELIVNKCKYYNLDAILISRLRFIHVTYTVMFAPIAQNYDTEVEMKLIDRNGNLILNTRHNTYKGNSYMTPPPAERTVMDGAKGALKRIYTELDK
jgi:hypothetical protein